MDAVTSGIELYVPVGKKTKFSELQVHTTHVVPAFRPKQLHDVLDLIAGIHLETFQTTYDPMKHDSVVSPHVRPVKGNIESVSNMM